MQMVKGTYHPNAYMSQIRNIKRGLKARTRILDILERNSAGTRIISEEAGMKYAAVVHHLKLLKNEMIIERLGKGPPYTWALTGKGQKRL
jgi:predicted transcriptional regulator